MYFNALESKEACFKNNNKKPWLTFDQPLVVQLAGQGMCVLQDDMDSGLGMCSQSLGRRAFCSSTLTAWMQRTVLLVCPELPQLAEHFCHSPTHQLSQKHKNGSDLMACLKGKNTIFHSRGEDSESLRINGAL